MVRAFGQAVGFAWRSGYRPNAKVAVAIATLPICIASGAIIYHSELVPITGRRHLVWLSKEEEQTLSEEGASEILQHESAHLLSHDTELYKQLDQITERVFNLCKVQKIIDPESSFTLHIIESPIPNAFVLPNGTIFVYTGILPFARTEAGMAYILGHEISHAIGRHSSEKVGVLHLLLLLVEFIRGLSDHDRTWTRIAIEFLAITVLRVSLPLAHSRKMESEADAMGLSLSAGAGYDPSHAALVWKRFIKEEEIVKQSKVESVSTSSALTGGSILSMGGSNTPVGSNPPTHTNQTTTTQANTPAPITNKQDALSGDGNISLFPLTVRESISELFSTHPCHRRRSDALEAYAATLQPTFQSVLDNITSYERNSSPRLDEDGEADIIAGGLPVLVSAPISEALLKHPSVPGYRRCTDSDIIDDPHYTEDDMDTRWSTSREVDWIKSMELANKCSALLVGDSGQAIISFLKEIGRDFVIHQDDNHRDDDEGE
jgi:metalloendopeptidase OMA1, mitochondrial